MSIFLHFPPDILRKMLDYGDKLLAERQIVCEHDFAQRFGGLVIDSVFVDMSYGQVRRYVPAGCVKCFKDAYYDIVSQMYVYEYEADPRWKKA